MKRPCALVTMVLCLMVLFTGSPSVAGGKPGTPADPALAYVLNGVTDKIYVSNVDGSNATAVYAPPKGSGVAYPSWSPESGSIVFGTDPGFAALDVQVINGVPKGVNLRTIVSWADCVGCLKPRWSPAGSEIAASAGSLMASVVVFSDAPCSGASCVSTLYSFPADYTSYSHVTWSPSGDRIAFAAEDSQRNSVVNIIDRATGGVLNSFPMGTLRITAMDWARLSDRIAVSAFDTNGNTIVYILDFMNPLDPVLTQVVAGSYSSWAPDDSELLFRVGGLGGSAGLKIINLGSLDVRQVLKSSYTITPDWRR